MPIASLRISEIFYSLQGEGNSSGWPTIFVRLTGCPLRCHYCDTRYAFSGGETLTLTTIINRIAAYPCQRLCITGGEPLAQQNVHLLMRQLCDLGYQLSLETSGALSTAAVDARVTLVLDLKTPGSGECANNDYDNLTQLRPQDQVKFVLTNREDYLWAKEQLALHQLDGRCTPLFSVAAGELAAEALAAWILADGLQVRLQLQLHRLLWGDKRGC
ncbi:MAG: 7-carboxy-7-deazaguanine synthase QueE [Gammaproteobacteria bacterium]|nr:7-carboxy-7-deazaguanine synthase QueE [Gammaproteobacteria bacterium]